MHVLLLTHHFPPENAAPQRRWDAFGRRFAAAGHRVSVVCPPPHYPSGRLRRAHRREYGVGTTQVTEYGARVHRTAYLQHGSDIVSRTLDHLVAAADAVRVAMRATRGHRPDVIIATAPGIPTIIAGRVLGSLLGRPVVVEMRDAWPDLVTHTPGLAGERGVRGLVKRTIHRVMTRWQQGADHVVTTTQRFADVLEGRGIARPSVIRNGTAVERYARIGPRDPDHEELRALYMGNLGRSQGLEHVIRVAARMREAGVRIDVRIVGHGADASRLRRLNAALGDPVDLRDHVPATEVAGHYEWADTTIVSLRDWHPFEWTVPSKLYEMLATGRHVTGIVGGEAAEIVADSGAGDVVAPGDEDGLAALWALLAADRRRLETHGPGRAWAVEHCDYDRLAARYLGVLDRVVGGR